MTKGKGSYSGVKGTKMKDGKLAWKTESGNYYARREPDYENWTHLAYYSLTKEPIQLAKGQCNDCLQTIQSKSCGDFVSCGCGKSFVDTDRWFPERHRYGGNVTILK